MPSSFSTSLRFELQFTGENLNVWGVKLSNTLARVDDAIAGYVAIAVTGDTTITSSNDNSTSDQARQAHLKLTGSPGAAFTVTIPAVSKSYKVWNATAYGATVTTGSGSTVAIDAGDIIDLWTDGANVKTTTFGGLSLKAFIAASALAATGALPAATGNDDKILMIQSESWAPYAWTANGAQVLAASETLKAITPAAQASARAVYTLTDGASITPDLELGANFAVTLAGNRTLANPANLQEGRSGVITVKQDATGSRTLAYGSGWKFPGGTPALSTAANAVDTIAYFVEDAATPVIRAVMAKAYA